MVRARMRAIVVLPLPLGPANQKALPPAPTRFSIATAFGCPTTSSNVVGLEITNRLRISQSPCVCVCVCVVNVICQFPPLLCPRVNRVG